MEKKASRFNTLILSQLGGAPVWTGPNFSPIKVGLTPFARRRLTQNVNLHKRLHVPVIYGNSTTRSRRPIEAVTLNSAAF